jgi:hypothetical protein
MIGSPNSRFEMKAQQPALRTCAAQWGNYERVCRVYGSEGLRTPVSETFLVNPVFKSWTDACKMFAEKDGNIKCQKCDKKIAT